MRFVIGGRQCVGGTFLLLDGDEAGRKAAERWQAELGGYLLAPLEDGDACEVAEALGALPGRPMNEVLCSVSRLVCALIPPVVLVGALVLLAVVLLGYRVVMGDLRRAKWSLVALLLLAGLLAPVPNGQGGKTAAFYPLIRMLTGGYGACTFIGPPPRYTPSPDERPVKGLSCRGS